MKRLLCFRSMPSESWRCLFSSFHKVNPHLFFFFCVFESGQRLSDVPNASFCRSVPRFKSCLRAQTDAGTDDAFGAGLYGGSEENIPDQGSVTSQHLTRPRACLCLCVDQSALNTTRARG